MDTLIVVFAALFGASLGSFLNVCIFRLPRACLRLWKPKLSFCPTCTRTLEWWENVPVLAYIFLGGRCRGCKAPIPLRYFLVELGTAVLFVFLANRHLLGAGRDIPLFLVEAGFGASLIVCGLIDWDHRVIPDEIDIPGFALAPLIAALVPQLHGERLIFVNTLSANVTVLLESALPWWGLSPETAHTIASPFRAVAEHFHGETALRVSGAFTSIVGAGTGAALIWFVAWAGERIFKREAMGFGDVKFMAMLGGFLGFQGIFATIVAASVLGSIWGILHKVRSGKTVLIGKELVLASPLSYLALRVFGAPSRSGYKTIRALLKRKEPIPLRFGGGLAARFATGDSYLAFGPFLALGAGIYAYFPAAIWNAYLAFGQFVRWLVLPGPR